MVMISDPERLPDQRRDPGTSPQVRGKAGVFCAEKKGLFQLDLPAGVYPRRPAGGGLRFKPLRPLLAVVRLPAADGAPVDLELSGDYNRGNPFIEKDGGLLTAMFELGRASKWSHGGPPTHSIGHYLGVTQ